MPESDAIHTQVYTLRINDVQERDAGTYQCINSAKINVPAEVVLEVQTSTYIF